MIFGHLNTIQALVRELKRKKNYKYDKRYYVTAKDI